MKSTLALLLLISSCGDMGRISNQSYQCMMEGGDDYCRPAPRATPQAGPQGPKGDRGVPGSDGQSGTSGTNGYSIVTSTEGILDGDFFCPEGGTRLHLAQDSNRSGSWEVTDSEQQLINICSGTDGSDGQDGNDGIAGATGPKGDPGEPGSDAPPNPLTPVELVDPCGDTPGVFDEVFLRMYSGILLASFSDNSGGKNTRLSVIIPGSYVTTDGSNCHFQVNSQMEIEYAIH